MDLSSYRWTLDQKEDLKFIQAVYNELKRDVFYMSDILELFNRQPKLLKINSDIMRNEGYLKSSINDKVVRL